VDIHTFQYKPGVYSMPTGRKGLCAAHLSAGGVSREQKNGDDQLITIRNKEEALEQDAYSSTRKC
jgi:hypothetical protein